MNPKNNAKRTDVISVKNLKIVESTLSENLIKKKGNDLIYGNGKSKPDPAKEYEKKVKKLELQSREWKAKKNIELNKKQYEDAIKRTNEVLKNDLGTITIKNKKKK